MTSRQLTDDQRARAAVEAAARVTDTLRARGRGAGVRRPTRAARER